MAPGVLATTTCASGCGPRRRREESPALERLLERAGEEGVDIGDATLLLPAPGHAAFSVCDARLDCRLDLDPASGRVLPPTPALDLLLNLHKSLFVGFPGRVLVSLFGVSLLLLCLAGVLLHAAGATCGVGGGIAGCAWRCSTCMA